MKLILAYFTSLFLFSACITEPSPPLPPEKMKALLMDVHFAEAYSMMVTDSLHYLREKNRDSLAVFYNDVLAHHHLTKDEFLDIVDWYRRHPQQLDSVYANMISDMTRLESRYP